MSVITNPDAWPETLKGEYRSVEAELESEMRTCFPAHTIHSCSVLSEDEMDKVFPPEIRAINERMAKKKVLNYRNIKKEIDEFLKGESWFRAEVEKLNKKQYANLLSFLVKVVDEYVSKGRSEVSHELHDLDLGNDSNLNIPDLVGILTYNNKRFRKAAEDVKSELQRLTIFNASGCFKDDHVYLCPTRMEMSSAFLGCKPSEVLEIIWIHEEIHGLLRANIGRSIEEHVVQTMTAGVLEKSGKDHLLRVMMHFSRNQPDEYALFCEKPNIDLLSIRNVSRRKMDLAQSDKQRTMSRVPLRIDRIILERIEEATGGPLTKIGDGMLRTANGKYILVGVEQDREWVVDWDLARGMPVGSSFFLLIQDTNVSQYVIPLQWLIDHFGDRQRHGGQLTGKSTMKMTDEGTSINEFFFKYDNLS